MSDAILYIYKTFISMFVAYSELKCVTSGTEIINIIIVVIVIIVGFIIIIIVIIIASP